MSKTDNYDERMRLVKTFAYEYVRFNHDPNNVYLVTDVTDDCMLELEGMSGLFAPHVFQLYDAKTPPAATTPPDFTEQAVKPEQIVLGTARLHRGFRKWLIEQLTAMGDGRLQWEPSPQYVADFTEQARQLLETFMGQPIPDGHDYDCDICRMDSQMCQHWQDALIERIASFAAEGVTQGQSVGIERARQKVVEAIDSHIARWRMLDDEVELWKVDSLRTELTADIHQMSPDPSYLDRVRNEARKEILAESTTWNTLDKRTRERIANEAATAALEQAAGTVCGFCAQGNVPIFANEAFQHRLKGETPWTVCYANKIRLLIAAIGDDKEQQR